MALDNTYLEYPLRRYGMDHNRYDWSMLAQRPPVQWPGGKKLALWVNVSLQFFPLNAQGKPFKAPGSMTMPYPDLRHFTLRDYGNRVGVFRLLKVFDRLGIRPAFAVNADLAARAPYLMGLLRERGYEIIAHGWNMDTLHYGGMNPNQEADLIRRSLDVLRQTFQRDIAGWLSPARSESAQTPDLLAAHGIRYFCDWVNDDMPYTFRTAHGPLVAMPLPAELEDVFVLMNNLHSEESYMQQIMDAADFLLAEAETQGGRMLGLSLHAWMTGQPHRIAYLERALEYVLGKGEVWAPESAHTLAAYGPWAMKKT